MINNKLIKKYIFVCLLFSLLCVYKKDFVISNAEARVRKGLKMLDESFDAIKSRQALRRVNLFNETPEVRENYHLLSDQIPNMLRDRSIHAQMTENIKTYSRKLFNDSEHYPYKERVQFFLGEIEGYQNQYRKWLKMKEQREHRLLRLLRNKDIGDPQVQETFQQLIRINLLLKKTDLRVTELKEVVGELKKGKGLYQKVTGID